MKTALFAALAATAMFTAIASSASVGQYFRWEPSGSSNAYTDFTLSSPSGNNYTGSIKVTVFVPIGVAKEL